MTTGGVGGSLLVRVNGDAAVFLRKSKQHTTRVRLGPLIRNRDGDKNVIVPSVGRYGVRGRSDRQVAKKFARRGVNDAEGRIVPKTEGGVEAIVARVVPNFIGALRLLNSGDRFASQRVQDQKRLPALATHEQMLGGTECET